MRFENRLPAEGINTSREHPLKEFAWLAGGVLASVAIGTAVVAYGAQWLAPRIPFKYELRFAGSMGAAAPRTEAGRAVQAQLQALAERLAARMELPAQMKVKVGYQESAIVNAYATLGGNATFFRGLLEQLDSEDALAMVIAHELAHLKHRHPAAALGRGVAVGIVLSMLSADLGRASGGGVLAHAGSVTLLAFSRDQERQADEEALRALAAEYGHVGGALDLFAVFARARSEKPTAQVPEFLATHPVTANRIAGVRGWAARNGQSVEGLRRPLPGVLAQLRAQAGSRDGTSVSEAMPPH